MEITTVIGFIGLALGLCVAPPQIYKTLKTKSVKGVSKVTYIILCLTIACYFVYALSIKDLIFSLSNGINLLINGYMATLLFKYGEK